MNVTPAPALQVSRWFNTPRDLSLEDLRGKVVVIEAFQMLCPGCVAHGLPQAQAIHQAFPDDQLAVIGLHSVFEHHAAMTSVALEAFLHEYRITFQCESIKLVSSWFTTAEPPPSLPRGPATPDASARPTTCCSGAASRP